MQCETCQHPNPDTALFCAQCGSRLSATDSPHFLERRHLTVVFCDLVGSTALSEQLDPEDYHEILFGYRNKLNDIINVNNGFVARFLGDGMLAYFGYPKAREDDVERAARASLEIIGAIHKLHGPNETPLSARIGIATGTVVARDVVATGTEQEHAITGDIPNLAARLQSQAGPDQILISESTHRILSNQFRNELFGKLSLKGISEPVTVYRLHAENLVESRFRAKQGYALKPLVGRLGELRALADCFEQVKQGKGQIAVIAGEAGIGKSRLVYEFIVHCKNAFISVFQCSPQHTGSAFYPLVQQFSNHAELNQIDDLNAKKARIGMLYDLGVHFKDAEQVFYNLLGLVDAGSESSREINARDRAAIMAALVSHFKARAAIEPVVLVIEDAHWIDPSTVELLTLIARETTTARVCILTTSRSGNIMQWSQELSVLNLDLAPLAAPDAASIIRSNIMGKELPKDMIARISTLCDGNPLYLEELTKSILDQPDSAKNARSPRQQHQIPATLQDILTARLDRLGHAKHVVQVGSVIGRSFSLEKLCAITEKPHSELQKLLDLAVSAEVVNVTAVGSDTGYTFNHALIQDAAYEGLLRKERRSLHERYASILVDDPSAATQPDVIAYHLEQATRLSEAAVYWEKAGTLATERSANLEAINHLQHALTLRKNEKIDRDKSRELDIAIRLVGAIRATQGYAAAQVGTISENILKLARELENKTAELNALSGLYSFHLLRSDLAIASQYAQELLRAAMNAGNVPYEMAGLRAVGIVAFNLGMLKKAENAIQKALKLYDAKKHAYMANIYGSDHAETCASYLSLAYWVSGKPDAADELQSWAIGHAKQLNHAHSISQSIAFRSFLYTLDRDWDRVLSDCEEAIAASETNNLKLMSIFSQATQAIALAYLHDATDACDRMIAAIEAMDRIVPCSLQPILLTTAADLLLDKADSARATVLLDRARNIAAQTGEKWAAAETERVYSRVMFAMNNPDAGQQHLQNALTIADEQVSIMWRLRAVADLHEREQSNQSSQLLKAILDRINSTSYHYDINRGKQLLAG